MNTSTVVGDGSVAGLYANADASFDKIITAGGTLVAKSGQKTTHCGEDLVSDPFTFCVEHCGALWFAVLWSIVVCSIVVHCGLHCCAPDQVTTIEIAREALLNCLLCREPLGESQL